MSTGTAAGKRHMGRVAALGCVACVILGYGETPPEVHHIREGRIERNDFLTIGLCPPHHRGKAPGVPSIHHDKERLLRSLGVLSEFDLLARVLEDLAR